MFELIGEASNLLALPGVWERLHQSGFFLVDRSSKSATPSRFMSSLGFTAHDFLVGNFDEAIHPGDRSTYQTLWGRVLEGKEDEFFAEYRVRTKKGGYRWVQTLCIVLQRDRDGLAERYFGLDRDIGLRKQSESLLHSRFLDLERRYLMSENLRLAGSVVTASLDIDSTIPVILEQAQTLFPFSGARVWAFREGTLELLGQEEDPSSVDLFSPSTRPLVLIVAQDKTPHIVDNLGSRLHISGPELQASWIGIPLLFQGQARGVMEFWHDESGFFRTEHVWPAMAFADNVAVGLFNARQYRDTQEASETDALTGLATRRRLERVGPALFNAAKDQGESLTVFMVDLDHFKTINDTWGHARGDAVLRHFARSCLSVLRKGDLMCRYGGDEFVAVLPHTTGDDALPVAQRIIELFKDSDFELEEPRATLSLGLASLNAGDFADIKSLLEAADQALYRVKARGRDGIEVYTP